MRRPLASAVRYLCYAPPSERPTACFGYPFRLPPSGCAFDVRRVESLSVAGSPVPGKLRTISQCAPDQRTKRL